MSRKAEMEQMVQEYLARYPHSGQLVLDAYNAEKPCQASVSADNPHEYVKYAAKFCAEFETESLRFPEMYRDEQLKFLYECVSASFRPMQHAMHEILPWTVGDIAHRLVPLLGNIARRPRH